MNNTFRSAGSRSEVYMLAMLTLLLLPFLILNYFNYPTTEDFYYGELMREMGFADSQRFLSNYWGGRFFSYVLQCVGPLFFKSITAYKISTLLLMIAFVYILYAFVARLGRELQFSDRLTVFSCILFLYLYAMPSVGQGFYWYVSVICYHLPMMFFMLFGIFFTHIEQSDFPKKVFFTLLCVLSVVAVCGTNEIAGAILIMTLTLLTVKYFLIDRKPNWYLVLIFAVALISLYISFTLPGNSKRAGQYAGNHELIFSVITSFSFLGMQLLDWLLNSPLLVISFLLFPVLLRFTRTDTGKAILPHPLFAVLICFAFVYSGIFIMLWSAGIVPYDRILNLIYFVFLAGWFYSVSSVIRFIDYKHGIRFRRFPGALYAAAIVILAVFLLRDNNIRTAYSELFGGAASDFGRVMNARYDYIVNSQSDSVTVDPLPPAPRSFFYLDITTDPNIFYNTGYAKYFNKKAISLKRSDQ